MAALLALQAVAAPPPAADDPNHTLKYEWVLDERFFRSCDKDNDGRLSIDEFANGLADEIQSAVDKNPAAKKKITPDMVRQMAKESAAHFFPMLDRNKDGFLDPAELKAANAQIRQA